MADEDLFIKDKNITALQVAPSRRIDTLIGAAVRLGKVPGAAFHGLHQDMACGEPLAAVEHRAGRQFDDVVTYSHEAVTVPAGRRPPVIAIGELSVCLTDQCAAMHLYAGVFEKIDHPVELRLPVPEIIGIDVLEASPRVGLPHLPEFTNGT